MGGESYTDLVRSEAVKAMIGDYVDELNALLNRWETIKKWELLDHDLTIESGELTPSLKVKRSIVEANNKDLIDAFYG
jgi:long-chain acyl-CoA synthetase